MKLAVGYLIRIEETSCGLLIDIRDRYFVVSASEVLVSDDEGAVSPTEMSRNVDTLAIVADCTISVRYQEMSTTITRPK